MAFNIWFRGLILSLLFSVKLFGQDLDVLPAASSLSLSNKILVDQGSRSKSATLTQLQSLIGGSSITATPPLTYSTGVMGIQLATTSQNGYLSSIDWNTFNGKQAALGFTAANDANVVHKTGSETVAGLKTFTNGIQSTSLFAPNGSTGMTVAADAGAVDYMRVEAGNPVELRMEGTSTNIGLTLKPKGTGLLDIQADGGIKLKDDFVAVKRFNKTLIVETATVTQSTSGSTNYAIFIVPAQLLAKDGDVVSYEITADGNGTSSKGFKVYFNGIVLTECTHATLSINRGSRTVKVIRTSNTTAEYHVSYSNLENVGAYVPLTGLNFASNDYYFYAELISTGGGTTSTGRCARLTFEPAP